MEPTIGRMVHVTISGDTSIYPAAVIAVHGTECISVNAFTFNGVKVLTSLMKAELSNDVDQQNWDWMPYQKAQAGA